MIFLSSKFNLVGADGCPPFLETVPKPGAIRRAAARPYENNTDNFYSSDAQALFTGES
jgi:hypothetical protein